MKPQGLTKYEDYDGNPIPYGAWLDMTWWSGANGTDEHHINVKIRKRKFGDVFEILTDFHGRPLSRRKFHRLSALNWCEGDLTLLTDDEIQVVTAKFKK